MPGKTVHDYKVPNDPDANEWTNLCLEDIGIYWDLPNFDEAKWDYFHAVQFKNDGCAQIDIPTPAVPDRPDDFIDGWFQWRMSEQTHQHLYRSFGGVAAASLGMGMMCMI
jgi:hypothetical protein